MNLSMSSEYVVELKNAVKRFPGVVALNQMHLAVRGCLKKEAAQTKKNKGQPIEKGWSLLYN